MPQFDFHSFSSQIFWLIFCFFVLYYFMSKVFLPRIRDIIKERHNNISDNKFQALELRAKIDEIETNIQKIKKEAQSEYKKALSNSSKEAALSKDKKTQQLKLKIADLIKSSTIQISEFKKESAKNSQELVEKIAKDINKTIFKGKLNK